MLLYFNRSKALIYKNGKPKFADGRPMSPFDDEASLPPTETTTRISPAVIGALVLAILAALGIILWFVCFTL